MHNGLVHIEVLRDDGDFVESTNNWAKYATEPGDSRKYNLDTPTNKLQYQETLENMPGEHKSFTLGPCSSKERPTICIETTTSESISIKTPPRIDPTQDKPKRLIVELGNGRLYDKSVIGQFSLTNKRAARIKSPDPANFGKMVKWSSNIETAILSMDFDQGYGGLRKLCKKYRPNELEILVDQVWPEQYQVAVEMGYPKPTQTYPILRVLKDGSAPMTCNEIRHSARLIGAANDSAPRGLLKFSRKYDAVWEILSALNRHGYIQQSKEKPPRFNLISDEPVDSLCKTIERKFAEHRKDCAKLARLLKKGDQVTVDDYDRLEKGLRFSNTTSTQQTTEQV